VAARLLTVAAHRHIAPKTAGIAASVEEQPGAIGADPQPCDGVALQQRQCGNRQGRFEGDGRRRIAERPSRRTDLGVAVRETLGAGLQKRGQISGGDRAVRHRTAKQPVGRLADPQHDRRDFIRQWRFQPPAAKLGGAKATCRVGETGNLRRIVETVEGFLGIATQHDSVRRVERKKAAGEAVWGPGNGHERHF
jgi:hypothetical protein